MENLTSSSTNYENNIELDPIHIQYLRAAGRWAMFLAILGFIGIGIMIILALFVGVAGSALGSGFHILPAAAITAIYIIMAFIYFIPVYYLYKFADNAIKLVRFRNKLTLTETFKYLKNHYQFMGIFTIVIISIYVLILIISIGIAALRY